MQPMDPQMMALMGGGAQQPMQPPMADPMAMDPGMAPEDPTGEMGPDPRMDQMMGLDPQMGGFPSLDPMAIVSMLTDMRTRDMQALQQKQMMEMAQFEDDANMAAQLAIEAIRGAQAGSASTATDPAAGFQSGIGMPQDDLIA